ncbi:YoaK family protein [Streptomyces sp. NPDC051320]|uniref:YoaK family protein n=1 Tax=Streptomyces sp. NPDC051320 TaxID=3154644 RepID=UPI00343E88B7
MTSTRTARLSRATALALLAAASGSVDALAFIALGHVFAGVMTGNLVLLAIALGSRSPGDAGFPLVALAGFSIAVIAAGRICRVGKAADGAAGSGGRAGPGKWSGSVYACLAADTVVLAGVGVAWAAVEGHPDGVGRAVLIAVLALAMGLQTGAMLAAGPQGAPTTYFTSTLSNLLTSPSGSGLAVFRLAALMVGAVGAAALHTWMPAWAACPPPVLTALAVAAALVAERRRR